MAVYKKWDFNTPVEKTTALYAVYDCSPDYGSITYRDGSEEKKYFFVDQNDFDRMCATTQNPTTDLEFYTGLKVKRADVLEVEIGKNVNTIGDYFAAGLTSLRKLVMGVNVQNIGNYFLSYSVKNTNLDEPFTLPAGLVYIGSYFLNYCQKFNQPLAFPDSLSTIGQYFMYYCQEFDYPMDLSGTSVTILNQHFMHNCRAFDSEFNFPRNLSIIYNEFFSSCRAFNHTINFPDSVTSIQSNFMNSCASFNQPIVIPPRVSTINSNFLSYAENFNQPIVIPNTVTEINGFLENCTGFNQPVNIPSSVRSIKRFLYYCREFNQPVEFPASITTFGDYNLARCTKFNSDVTFMGSIEKIGISFLEGCQNFNAKLTLPNGLKTIDGSFLYECFVFNQPLDFTGVTSIGNGFMNSCRNYNHKIDFEKFTDMTTWGTQMASCYSYEYDVILPPTIKSITSGAFSDLRSNKGIVVIPESVTSIAMDWSVNNSYIIRDAASLSGYQGDSMLFGKTLIIESDYVVPTDTAKNYPNCSVYTSASTPPNVSEYTVKVAGKNAQKWKDALVDLDGYGNSSTGTTKYYRHLEVVPDPRTS